MQKSKKRKRDTEYPRITYHAPGRTFDRLFKEESLTEMKEVARAKLGLAPDASVDLAQIREGRIIDLEDADDFDAFGAVAYATSIVNVRVTVGTNNPSLSHESLALSVKKKRRTREPLMPEEHISVDLESIVPPHTTERARDATERTVSIVSTAEGGGDAAIAVSEHLQDEGGDISGGIIGSNISGSTMPHIELKGLDSMISNSRASPPETSQPPDASVMRVGIPELDVTPFSAELANSFEFNIPLGGITTAISTLEEAQPSSNKLKSVKRKKKRRTVTSALDISDSEYELPAPPIDNGHTKRAYENSAPPDHEVLAEQLAGTISESGETSDMRGHSEMLASAKGNLRKNKAKVGKSRASLQKAVASGSARKSHSYREKPPVSDSTTGINMKRRALGQAEGKELRESGDRSNGAANKRKGKARASTTDEIGTLSAVVQAAFSRVLAANRASLASSTAGRSSPQTPQRTNTSRKRKAKQVTETRSQLLSGSSEVRDKGEPSPFGQDSSRNRTSLAAQKEPPALQPEAARSPPQDVPEPTLATCSLCLLSPHDRDKCPLVFAGAYALKTRILELQRDITEDNTDRNTKTISELQELLGSRKSTRNNGLSKGNARPSLTRSLRSPSYGTLTKEGAFNPEVDLEPSTVSIRVNATDGHPLGVHEPPEPGAVAESSGGTSSSDVSDIELYHEQAVALSIPKDVTPYSKVDLEALVRGPISSRITVADLSSTDTSEEEPDFILAEDEDKGDKSHHVRRTNAEDSTDAGDDTDADDSFTEAMEDNDNFQPELPPDPDMGHLSFEAVDRLGESQDIDNSGDVAFSDALAADTAIFKLADHEGAPDRSLSDSRNNEDILATAASSGNATARVLQDETSAGDNDGTVDPADKVGPPEEHTQLERILKLNGQGGSASGGDKIANSVVSSTYQNLHNADTIRDDDSIAKRTKTARRKQPPTSALLLPLQTSTPRPPRHRRQSNKHAEMASVSLPAPTVDDDETVALGRDTSVAIAPEENVQKHQNPKIRKPTSAQLVASHDRTKLIPSRILQGMSPREPSTSLGTWETLMDSSPHPDAESTLMIDELQPSSPVHGHSLTRNDRADSTLIPTDQCHPEEHPPTKDPLFVLTESQPPFPYSQWDSVAQLDEDRPASREGSDDEEEAEEVEASVQTEFGNAAASDRYRRLTDIASQRSLFARPKFQAAEFPPTKDKLIGMYGKSWGPVNSETSSDSSSDSDVEASHIPKSRRAGQTKL